MSPAPANVWDVRTVGIGTIIALLLGGGGIGYGALGPAKIPSETQATIDQTAHDVRELTRSVDQAIGGNTDRDRRISKLEDDHKELEARVRAIETRRSR